MLELNLTGHIAVVTGGSGNLGRVICRTLAQCGADICVHYNGSKDKAEKVAQETSISPRRPGRSRALPNRGSRERCTGSI